MSRTTMPIWPLYRAIMLHSPLNFNYTLRLEFLRTLSTGPLLDTITEGLLASSLFRQVHSLPKSGRLGYRLVMTVDLKRKNQDFRSTNPVISGDATYNPVNGDTI